MIALNHGGNSASVVMPTFCQHQSCPADIYQASSALSADKSAVPGQSGKTFSSMEKRNIDVMQRYSFLFERMNINGGSNDEEGSTSHLIKRKLLRRRHVVKVQLNRRKEAERREAQRQLEQVSQEPAPSSNTNTANSTTGSSSLLEEQLNNHCSSSSCTGDEPPRGCSLTGIFCANSCSTNMPLGFSPVRSSKRRRMLVD